MYLGGLQGTEWEEILCSLYPQTVKKDGGAFNAVYLGKFTGESVGTDLLLEVPNLFCPLMLSGHHGNT